METLLPATLLHLPAIMQIVQQAQAFLKQQGVNQWQNGYPNESVMRHDIETGAGFVWLVRGQVQGTVAICFGPEPSYANITGSGWRSGQPYATIHRIALAKTARGSGAASRLLQQAEAFILQQGVRCIRVDTHRQNQPMQKFLVKHGYVFCGEITLPDGSPRIAFDKLLPAGSSA